VNNDKASKDEREAATKPGCKCTLHCEHVHGDQADPELDELIRLRAEVSRLTAEAFERAECCEERRTANFERDAARARVEEYRREVERRDEYLRGADADLKEAYAEERAAIIQLIQNDGEKRFGCWDPALIAAIRARGGVNG
jgi:hypothetical protein